MGRIIALVGGDSNVRHRVARWFSAWSIEGDRKYIVLSMDDMSKSVLEGVIHNVIPNSVPITTNLSMVQSFRDLMSQNVKGFWVETVKANIRLFVTRGYSNFIVLDIRTKDEMEMLRDMGADFILVNHNGTVDAYPVRDDQDIHGILLEISENTFIPEKMGELVENYYSTYTQEIEDRLRDASGKIVHEDPLPEDEEESAMPYIA